LADRAAILANEGSVWFGHRRFLTLSLLAKHIRLAAFNDFAFAAHPAHEAFPALCRAAKGQKIVGGQTSGRDRCDIRGAVDP
jgi:hypothetical protein